jgi:hypothetical protein
MLDREIERLRDPEPRKVRIESGEDVDNLMNELTGGQPFVKKTKKDQPLEPGDPKIKDLRPYKLKKGKKPA